MGQKIFGHHLEKERLSLGRSSSMWSLKGYCDYLGFKQV